MPTTQADNLQGMVLAHGQLPRVAVHLTQNTWWADTTSLLLYTAGAVLVIALVWWLARRTSPWVRAGARAGIISLAFSPAILACGAVAIMPFPVLLLGAWQNPDATSCGAPLVALPPNAMTFGGMWLVFTLVFGLWHWFHLPSKGANQA